MQYICNLYAIYVYIHIYLLYIYIYVHSCDYLYKVSIKIKPWRLTKAIAEMKPDTAPLVYLTFCNETTDTKSRNTSQTKNQKSKTKH